MKSGVKQLVHFCLSSLLMNNLVSIECFTLNKSEQELVDEPVVEQYFGSEFILIAHVQGGVR